MFYLGVDGGGSKTLAILTDLSGNHFRKVQRGPGNMALLDRGTAAQMIHDLVDDLLDGEDPAKIACATMAFAGIGREREKNLLFQITRGAGIEQFNLMTDGQIQYYAAFGEEPGVLLSAGTGSICLLKTADGPLEQLGGKGYLLGDEGSGYYIGNLAIRNALEEKHQDRGFSELTRQILAFYAIVDPDDLISLIYTARFPQRLIASCTRTVMKNAASGSTIALEILEKAAEHLLQLFNRAAQHFDKSQSIPLCLTGGVLNGRSPLRDLLEKRLVEKYAHLDLVTPKINAAAAAVMHAIQESGTTISKELKERLSLVQL